VKRYFSAKQANRLDSGYTLCYRSQDCVHAFPGGNTSSPVAKQTLLLALLHMLQQQKVIKKWGKNGEKMGEK
jgi:hypothetical protein